MKFFNGNARARMPQASDISISKAGKLVHKIRLFHQTLELTFGIKLLRLLLLVSLLVVAISPALVNASPLSTQLTDVQPAFPIRAAFYYDWYPEAWTQQGVYPYSNYKPTLGYYDSSDPTVIAKQITAMQYGHIQAGIVSWWGQGSRSDQRVPAILAATANSTFRWVLYYEAETQNNPASSEITNDLTYIQNQYGSDPSYLRINGQFVVFVHSSGSDDCSVVSRWKQGNTVNAYIVLKVFTGYKTCADQPDGWHQDAPSKAADSQAGYSYTISPGYWKVGADPLLTRDLTRWNSNIQDMNASGAPFQLIATFNEWGEGTAVESASAWSTASSYGAYLDALHNNGLTAAATPSLTATPLKATSTPTLKATATKTPTTTPTSISGSLFKATADAQVKEATPTSNFGTGTTLAVDNASGANIESYLRFSVSGLSGAVQSAKLRIYDTTNGSINGPVLYGTDTSWSETGITWNNRPAKTTGSLGNKSAVDPATWMEYDVTTRVTTNGTYSFALVGDSSDGLTFSSREGSQPPQLVITTSAGVIFNPTSTPTTSSSVTFVGAGDIASCNNNNDELTAELLDKIAGTVFNIGDNAYDNGTYAQYVNCYDPTWGRHKARTKPVPGNHEYYLSTSADGYFQYFSTVPNYYAFNLGAWRIYALNSEIDVSATGAEVKWLKSDLAAHPHLCVLAYWHKPRWSSGTRHGTGTEFQALWQVLYDAGAELVLNGHEHNYERFTQMNGSGQPVTQGLRAIVVGTGGVGHHDFPTTFLSTSQVHNATTYGVLKLTLNSGSYSWKFIPVVGSTFTDSGTTSCH